MARVGLPYSVFARIDAEPTLEPIVYGFAVPFHRPIEANITYERADNPLYGGDVIAENDNSITGGELSFNHTHLTPAERGTVLGHTKVGESPDEYYIESGNPSPTGGFGYVTKEIENNITKFYAFWIYKTQLNMPEDNATTKRDGIEWQTPTLTGPIMGVMVDPSGVVRFRAYQVFSTFAEAKAWVDEMAGLQAVATPTATPVAGAVAADSTVALASTTDGAVIHYTTNGATPTTASPVYSAPITVSAAMTIKAIAVKEGMSPSAVMSSAYTIQV